MKRRAFKSEPDALRSFLTARDEVEANRHLERLLRDADPLIRDIIRIKWQVSLAGAAGSSRSRDAQLAEDVRGEVLLHLIQRLRSLKAKPGERPITDYRAFVAVTTYRTCDHYLRRKYPQRTRLSNKLYYLLTRHPHQPKFALWQGSDKKWRCGFEKWRDQEKGAVRSRHYQQLLDDPHGSMAAALPRKGVADLHPADLLAATFHRVGGPLEFNDLVTVVAELWGVRDRPEQSISPDEEQHDDSDWRLADPGADVTARVVQRAYLQQLWAEVRQLSSRQCAALLLNLRDTQGRGVIALLPLLGIASMRQIAEVLCMPAGQLALLWNDLPMDDHAIARPLGVTRQQVINLRKAARERLARRMGSFEAAT